MPGSGDNGTVRTLVMAPPRLPYSSLAASRPRAAVTATMSGPRGVNGTPMPG